MAIVSGKYNRNEYVCGQKFLNDLKAGNLPSPFWIHEYALSELYLMLTTDLEALEALRHNEMRILMLAGDVGQIKELLVLLEPWQTE